MGNQFRAVAGPPDRRGGGRWPWACTCGVSHHVAGTTVSSRRHAEGWVRVHLRQDHGADLLREHTRGGTYTAWGVDERVLTKPERATYAGLVAAARKGMLTGADRRHRKLWVAPGVWVGLTAGCFAALVWSSDTAGGDPDLWAWALLVMVVVGGPVVLARVARTSRELAWDRVAAYLRQLGFDQREYRPRASGGEPAVSERQRQHQWYEEHGELDWHDRVQAEAWGMDADTYAANVVDRE